MGQASEPILLKVSNVSKRFGHTQALHDVSLTMCAGEVHALMGENGAGKSTLGKVIAGLHRQDAGWVELAGRRLTPGSIDDAFSAGVRIVHQELAQCPNLTVAENLCLHDLPRTRLGLVDRREMERRAAVLLQSIEPGIDVREPVRSLSPGHRQIVQIAAALDESAARGGRSPVRLIVFDEPTSSLSITEADRLLKIVGQLAARGITVVYVSHRIGEIFACCNRATVLRDGKFVATTPVSELDEPKLVHQMIGRRLEVTRVERRSREDQAPALEVQALSSPGRLRDVSVRVAPGEVVGIGGLVGAGRSELMDAIFGIDTRASGQVRVRGEDVLPRNPRTMIRAGVGYVPEDRRLQGLFFQLGVDENILMPVLPALARGGLRRGGAERALVDERMRSFQVKAASPRATPGSLSGGNQQKLLIARWMGPRTRVLLLDEPTRGIDVGTKAEVYRLIRAAADDGVAVLLVTSEMAELLLLSDRIMVLSEGRVTGELRGTDMTQENILRLATTEQRIPAGAGA